MALELKRGMDYYPGINIFIFSRFGVKLGWIKEVNLTP
jgi:hypothetical protein